MDPEMAQTVREALADEDIEPAALEQLADLVEADHPLAAAALRARAAELRQKLAAEDAKRGGTPFVIRKGDMGSGLALYYTGNAGRYRELPEVNTAIGMRIIRNPDTGIEYLVPWKVGETILLPLSWNARSKPLPPPGYVGGPITPSA